MSHPTTPYCMLPPPSATLRAWDALARRRHEERAALRQVATEVAIERKLVTPAAIRAALIPALPARVTREPYLAGRTPGRRVAITVVEMLALRALVSGGAQ